MNTLSLQLFSSKPNASVGDEITFTLLVNFSGNQPTNGLFQIFIVNPNQPKDCRTGMFWSGPIPPQSPNTMALSWAFTASSSGSTLTTTGLCGTCVPPANTIQCSPFTGNPNDLFLYATYEDSLSHPDGYAPTSSPAIEQKFQSESQPQPPPQPGAGTSPGAGQPAFNRTGGSIAGQFSRLMPCPNFIPCPGTDLPFINHSAAAPDPLEFVCMGFATPVQPPLGSSFTNGTGAASGQSTSSAQEACLTAQSNAVQAVVAGDAPWTMPTGPTFFTNTAQTCSYDCPTTGLMEVYTTPPGSFTSLTQAEANGLAHEYACLQAQLLAGCFGQFTNTAQSCIAACWNGSEQSYTTPAGMFSAATQDEANQLAYSFACLSAQIHCPAPPPSPPPGTGPGGPPFPVHVFYNQAQTATLDCEDGTPFAYTVMAGLFTAFSQIEANRAALQYAQQQAQAHQICMSGITPSSLTLNVPTTLQIFAAGSFLDPTSNTWNLVSGSLPIGYSFTEGFYGPTLQIQGTPLLPGTYTFTMKVTAPNGDNQQKTFTVMVSGGTLCVMPAVDPSSGPGPGVRGNTMASFGSFPAGRYVINYQNGALQYNPGSWHLNFGTDPFDGMFSGYTVIYGGGSVQFPDATTSEASQAAVESAFAGKNVVIQHTGGPIQMQFSDVDFSDNVAGSPAPTFCLAALS